MRSFGRLTAIFVFIASPCLAAQSQDCLRYSTTDDGTPIIQAMVQAEGPLSVILDTAGSGPLSTVRRMGGHLVAPSIDPDPDSLPKDVANRRRRYRR